jgi:hypothetical protein
VRELTKKVSELRVSNLEEQANNLEGINDEKAALTQKRIIKRRRR